MPVSYGVTSLDVAYIGADVNRNFSRDDVDDYLLSSHGAVFNG